MLIGLVSNIAAVQFLYVQKVKPFSWFINHNEFIHVNVLVIELLNDNASKMICMMMPGQHSAQPDVCLK